MRDSLTADRAASSEPSRLPRAWGYNLPMSAAPLIALISLAVLALLAADRAGRTRLALISKSCASLGFVLLGLINCRSGDPFDRLVLAGLLFAAAGDVALALPGERTFLAGVGAFAVGHLAYAAAAAVYVRSDDVPAYALAVFAPSLLAYGWLYSQLGKMRLPVAVYVLIISLMVVGAISLYELKFGAARLFLVGALLFYASDLSVARDKFVRDEFVNRLWGLPAYYAAQICIALSIAEL
jgi:uncharacterized membrane protein YhhN